MEHSATGKHARAALGERIDKRQAGPVSVSFPRVRAHEAHTTGLRARAGVCGRVWSPQAPGPAPRRRQNTRCQQGVGNGRPVQTGADWRGARHAPVQQSFAVRAGSVQTHGACRQGPLPQKWEAARRRRPPRRSPSAPAGTCAPPQSANQIMGGRRIAPAAHHAPIVGSPSGKPVKQAASRSAPQPTPAPQRPRAPGRPPRERAHGARAASARALTRRRRWRPRARRRRTHGAERRAR